MATSMTQRFSDSLAAFRHGCMCADINVDKMVVLVSREEFDRLAEIPTMCHRADGTIELQQIRFATGPSEIYKSEIFKVASKLWSKNQITIEELANILRPLGLIQDEQSNELLASFRYPDGTGQVQRHKPENSK